jgi:type II secretory pathway pseudopilin PulG
MNVRKPIQTRARAQGITLVEILLAVGLLIILVGFALPSAGSATARAEMKAALENLEYSIGTARNVARMSGSSVSLAFVSTPGAPAQKITFSTQTRKGAPEIPDYLLPESIELVSSQDGFVFDQRGLVEQPGRILLVSRSDDAVTSTLDIE